MSLLIEIDILTLTLTGFRVRVRASVRVKARVSLFIYYPVCRVLVMTCVEFIFITDVSMRVCFLDSFVGMYCLSLQVLILLQALPY